MLTSPGNLVCGSSIHHRSSAWWKRVHSWLLGGSRDEESLPHPWLNVDSPSLVQATCCELMSAMACPPLHHLTLAFWQGNLRSRKVSFCSQFSKMGPAVSAEHLVVSAENLVKPGAGKVEGAGTGGDKYSEQWSFKATLSRWLMPSQEMESSPTPKMETIYSQWSHLHKSNTSHSTRWQLTRQEAPAWVLVGTNHIQMIALLLIKIFKSINKNIHFCKE